MVHLTQSQKLALALKKAKESSVDGIVRSSKIDRQTRERLLAAGYLHEILQGWYLLSRPDAREQGSTAWYGSFWTFLRIYLRSRFGDDGYCLSAEASVSLQTGDTTIGRQVVVLTRKPSNQQVDLPHQTSILLYQDKRFPDEIETFDGLNVMPLASALTRLSPAFYKTHQENVEIALRSLPASHISRELLRLESPTIAGRIVGALEALGEEQKAQQILADQRAAGYAPKIENPFARDPILAEFRSKTPYVGRVQALWAKMRPQVLEHFGAMPNMPRSMHIIERLHIQDAYHSLSIEGYQVTQDLIERVERGEWHPEFSRSDREHLNAMAAKGYSAAFRSVLGSVAKVWSGRNPGDVFQEDLQDWYRELFSPSVQAGLIPPSSLAGFRNSPVYIRGSRHVPPRAEVVPEAMEALFDLLRQEPDARVRAVLGHFLFVFIHPYLDGNGRIGRFLMNFMLVTGGFHWTVIRVESRTAYMRALEKASVDHDISEFTKVVLAEMRYWQKSS